tara:strand:- start:440 stop:1624 length:1185 start_codon:yes stop_codon:yes gene_type:complete
MVNSKIDPLGLNSTLEKLKNENQFAKNMKSYLTAEDANSSVVNRTAGGAYRYPVDESYPVYMQYRVREVIPPLQNATDQVNELYQASVNEKIVPVKGSGVDVVGAELERRKRDMSAFSALEGGATQNLAVADANRSFQKRSGAHTGLLGFKTAYLENPIDIKLYMPPGVMFHDNIQYNQAQLGLAGAGGLQAFNDTGSGLSAIGTMLSETASSLTGLFSGGAGGSMDAARVAMARGVQAYSSVLSSGAQAAFNLGLQVRVNPNTRSVFEGVSVRNFSFQYDFYPTSKTEQTEVEKIIKVFRTEMYPRAIPESSLEKGFPLGYKFPNLFEINFKFGNAEIQGMPKPLFCFLRDVSTSYNPGNMSYHDQGKPSHINMNLSFTEFRALNQQDIEKGH